MYNYGPPKTLLKNYRKFKFLLKYRIQNSTLEIEVSTGKTLTAAELRAGLQATQQHSFDHAGAFFQRTQKHNKWVSSGFFAMVLKNEDWKLCIY